MSSSQIQAQNFTKLLTFLPFRPINVIKKPSFLANEKKRKNLSSQKKSNIVVHNSTIIDVKVKPKFFKIPVGIKNIPVEVEVRGKFPGTLLHFWDQSHASLAIELISTELDSMGQEKKIKGRIKGTIFGNESQEVTLETTLDVPEDFGEIGAISVDNDFHKDVYLHDFIIKGFPDDDDIVQISCQSWVTVKGPLKRHFFTNKSYLPMDTPRGLKTLREEELESKRGDGQGERQPYDRIYDYDIYNDLGNPDKHENLRRPPLGGSKHYPYPRRCRTGRPPCKTDPQSESRASNIYVPKDENFSKEKYGDFRCDYLQATIHGLFPLLDEWLNDRDSPFESFSEIDQLFNEGTKLPKQEGSPFSLKFLPRLAKSIADSIDDIEEEILQFEVPDFLEKDKFAWLSDDEFGRQTLAGLNPLGIQLVTKWPLKSGLDPEIYGPSESKITKEIVEKQIKCHTTFDQAITNKRLFMLDYHDILMPYVERVRELEGTTLYGSRTIFFLTDDGTLKPVAIELTCPPIKGKPQWSQVLTPSNHSTDLWLWRLAKAHVLAHDSGIHQLVSHWLRTHASVEPYIISANRQLSEVHPIYRLLHPHFRYTMEINALARDKLVNAGGVIESNFSPMKYSIELSSVAYDMLWRFDTEALPADLIKRGMAVEDPNAKHGLKLTIEDYPYANDGLILWDAIKQWVSDYVNHYYTDASKVINDYELQEWWEEVRTVGHGDKKSEPWWPILDTQEDLIHVLTTIIWVASGHHAAVNFGQYAYAAYFPNRPTIIRANMPDEDEKEKEIFMKKPEDLLLKFFPMKGQATKVISILDVLSSHAHDEEYIGSTIEPSWNEDPQIKIAHDNFAKKLKNLETIIDKRNNDSNNKNRNGAGVVPYELLKPKSEAGVTARGVPNSISI